MPRDTIPFYKPFLPNLEEYAVLLKEVWNNKRVTNNGPLVNQLERHLQKYLGVKHVMAVSSGTIGLQLCIKAMGIKGKVLTTPFSYVASSSSLVWENCTPVYSDINTSDYSFPISAQLIKQTKANALLPVHVFGFPFWGGMMENLPEIKIPVIVDAAHAFGIKQNGMSILHTPDKWANVVSLHATKVFHTIEGGAIITSDDSLAQRLRSMRNLGFSESGKPELPGINAKMSELHAAIGLGIFPHIKKLIARNKKIYEAYRAALKGNQSLLMNRLPPGLEYNYSFFPLICSTPKILNSFIAHLEKNKIGYKRYFNYPLNKLPYVRYTPCPEAESLSQRSVCLPIYSLLNDSQVERICSALLSFKG